MATLTGPITLPDGTPAVGVPIKVRLVAGNARAMGHVNGNTIAGIASAVTDEDGNFTINVDALPDNDADVHPSGAYYEVKVGGGRFKEYTRKVKPEDDLTYQLGDPDIFGESADLLPPEFVQVVPDFTTAEIEAAVAAYFVLFPIDVEDEVDAALATDPPLLVSENGADVDDPAQFRLNIGAASDTDIAALIVSLTDRIAALELLENADPALRLTDLGGGALVTAPGKTEATITDPGGAITITLT